MALLRGRRGGRSAAFNVAFLSGSTHNINSVGTYAILLTANRTLTLNLSADGEAYVRITQDSVGGRTFGINTAITWDAGVSPTFPTGANASSLIRIVKSGSTYFGFFIAGASQYVVPHPTTYASQTFHFTTGGVTRNTRPFVSTSYYNAFTTYVSAASRQRVIAARGFFFEIAARYATDNPHGEYVRGQVYFDTSWEDIGGFNGAGPSLCVRGYEEQFTPGTQAEADYMRDVVLHEYGHSEDGQWYCVNNPVDPYSAKTISDHPPLQVLHADCVAASTLSVDANRYEWLAALRGIQRREAQGATASTQNDYANLLGTLSGVLAGRPTDPAQTLVTRDRGTQLQRWDRFKAHYNTTLSIPL